ncbi:hypothetical protein Tco_0009265 [Tanacetum coccineum]
MAAPKFAETHNLVAFLSKPNESDGFEQIVDFLNANLISYALTVNPIVYTSCIEQFWITAKAKTVNRESQLQALVDGKRIVITESIIRRDLHLEDAEGTECLPNDTIFEQLTLMGYENQTQKLTLYKAFFSPQWKFLIHTILQCLSAKTTAWNELSSTMASAIICLATNKKFNFSKYIFDNMVKNLEGGVKILMYPRFVQVFINQQLGDMSKHKGIYVTPSHTKKIFGNMKREGKGFSGRVTPLFQTMMVQAPKELGEGSKIPTDPQYTPTTTQPSTSQPQKKQKPRRTQRKGTEIPSSSCDPIADKAANEEHVPTTSNDPLLSGEDSLQLKELMELCTTLQQRVLDLENTKTTQALEIESLKRRVNILEKKKRSRTHKPTRLYKVGLSRRIESSKDEEVTLIDETQGRNDDDLMFDTSILDEKEVEVEKVVSTAEIEVTTASATTITIDELTLAQTLIEIKAAKPKAVITAATTTITDVARPKARGVIVQEPSEFKTTTSQPSQLMQAKDKGKTKVVEPKKPLKKKDQIMFDKEVAQKLQAQLDAELEEEEKLARQREEDANIAEWDDVQAMMDADYELAVRLQAEEQGELTIEEKLRLFVELIDKRKKHFEKLRAEE